MVPALRELFDHLLVEGWYVVRLAAGYQAAVDNYFFVDPPGAGIVKIGLQGRPRSNCAAAHDICLDQRPWCMTDRGDGLATIEKAFYEFYRARYGAQDVRVPQSAC